ncbi:MAG: hypothetical protein IH950_12080 [Bacteroidetes bacterium]|nr:hypothetical protein [Bacteroidota bacterium]MCH8034476.1 hypothetical protein [Bacteroidota bacterium]
MESPRYDIRQLYEKLVDLHNKKISKAVITVALTLRLKRLVHTRQVKSMLITNKW